MRVRSVSLVDFRSYREATTDLAEGLTAIVGPNGQGKTNLLEAIGYAAGLGSFRGAADAALIRDGAESAVIRCSAVGQREREVLVTAELSRSRSNQIKVNQQAVARRRDLLGILAVTLFSPEDLELVKGDPAGRRRWIDDALAAVRPSWGVLRTDLDRILRQRNTLLKQAAGRATSEVAVTLDVWDERLAVAGDELRARRCDLLDALAPRLAGHYRRISGGRHTAAAGYVSSWGDTSLGDALAASRTEDLRRAVTTVGPHRDDIAMTIDGRPARSHSSQGEQRSLALALRLAVDAELRDRCDIEPVLLLDDLFSELDAQRSAALLEALPRAQRILTTASALPPAMVPDQVVTVADGSLHQGQP